MITTYARKPKLLRTGARLNIEINERSRKRLRSNLVRARNPAARVKLRRHAMVRPPARRIPNGERKSKR